MAGQGPTRKHRLISLVRKHLDVLAGAGLVADVRRGWERIWKLEADRLDEARRYLDQISRRWDERLDRPKKLVED